MLQTTSMLRAAVGVAVTAAMAQSLAGCSGAMHALPGGIAAAAQSHQAGNPYNAQVVAFPNAPAFITQAERRGASHNVIRAAGTKCLKNAYIYTSENTTADLDVFCEDASKQTQNALVSQTAGVAGWGVAVSPNKLPVPGSPCSQGSPQELLAVGTSGGTVDIYCNLSGGGYTKLNVKPLVLTQGDALGICWDQTGGIYTTEFPYNTIAHFSNAQLVTGGGPTILTTNVNIVEYHVACDYDKLVLKGRPQGENYLMAYGFDASGNVNVTNVNTSTGAETVEQNLGVYGSTAFPGGLALDRLDDLVVNNQYGTMYWFNPELWNTPPRGACRWGFNPNDFTDIVFDDAQNEIWASNVNFGGSSLVTYGQSNRFPFQGSGTCSTGSSGYQTSHPLPGESQDLGIAVYPNRGV